MWPQGMAENRDFSRLGPRGATKTPLSACTRAGENVIGFLWPRVALPAPQSVMMTTEKRNSTIDFQPRGLAPMDTPTLQGGLKILRVSGVFAGISGIVAP